MLVFKINLGCGRFYFDAVNLKLFTFEVVIHNMAMCLAYSRGLALNRPQNDNPPNKRFCLGNGAKFKYTIVSLFEPSRLSLFLKFFKRLHIYYYHQKL